MNSGQQFPRIPNKPPWSGGLVCIRCTASPSACSASTSRSSPSSRLRHLSPLFPSPPFRPCSTHRDHSTTHFTQRHFMHARNRSETTQVCGTARMAQTDIVFVPVLHFNFVLPWSTCIELSLTGTYRGCRRLRVGSTFRCRFTHFRSWCSGPHRGTFAASSEQRW